MDTRIYKNTCIQGYTRIHVFKDIQEYMDTRTYKNTGIQGYIRIHGYKDIQKYVDTRIYKNTWIQGYTIIHAYKDIQEYMYIGLVIAFENDRLTIVFCFVQRSFLKTIVSFSQKNDCF